MVEAFLHSPRILASWSMYSERPAYRVWKPSHRLALYLFLTAVELWSDRRYSHSLFTGLEDKSIILLIHNCSTEASLITKKETVDANSCQLTSFLGFSNQFLHPMVTNWLKYWFIPMQQKINWHPTIHKACWSLLCFFFLIKIFQHTEKYVITTTISDEGWPVSISAPTVMTMDMLLHQMIVWQGPRLMKRTIHQVG